MSGILHFETFLIAGILLNLTPGNDTIFILTKSIAQGKKAGIMSVLGISTGSLIHTTLAAFGLSVIIAKSIVAFTVIKYAGALYLFYIGYKMLTDKAGLNTGGNNNENKTSYLKIYRDAVITNVLNPKVALFFIAFLPQFIDPGFKNTVIPFLLLGITFTITGAIWCSVLAIFAAAIFTILKANKKVSAYVNKLCGAVLIGLGVKVALSGKS